MTSSSTALVQAEIKRFLQSKDAEVLCVKGDWGVGKTYTWHKILDEAKAAKAVALTRYSYVSLFGINSLENLKLSVFENLDFLDSHAETPVEQGIQGAKSFAALLKKFGGIATTLPYVGAALSKAGPLYFSLIRKQIVCIDDLERRGRALELKDVFGLISFLREQRSCKVILLLNADALEEDKAEFDKYFEKVIDARLIFDPTAAEATGIALSKRDQISELLRANCIALGISNIRVIKKLERLAKKIEPLLKKFAPEITESAIKSIALFGWSKFQPDLAPPIDFIRVSSLERYFARDKNKETPPHELKWDTLLTAYNFTHMDDLDRELLNFVDSGILDADRIQQEAKKIDEQVELQKQTGYYEQSWRPFHDSFDDNIDEVVQSIVDGLTKNIRVVSLGGLNAAIKLLKEIGRNEDAEELIKFFVKNKPGDEDFWDPSRDHFREGPYDPDLNRAITGQQQQIDTAQVFIAEEELLRAAETYNSDVIKKLSEIPIEDYYKMVRAKKGAEMRKLILAALNFRRIGNASPEMREVVRRMEEALKKIAADSDLNRVRVRRYGVHV